MTTIIVVIVNATAPDSHPKGLGQSDQGWQELVLRNVRTLRYGVVQIVVHDGRATQVERTEKVRLDSPASNYEI